jgi:hypothetical protein
MSDTTSEEKPRESDGDRGAEARPSYAQPKLVHIGNARELLAGAVGTSADGAPIGPLTPFRSG